MDFIKEVLAAVGGALGIVLIILAFGKGLVQKWVETTIEKTAEKSLTKYANVLERRTKAYEMLLEKEFVFFESASEFISNLIIDIHSFSRCLRTFNDDAYSMDFEKARETALRIMSNTQVFRRDMLLAQSFIPEEIFSVCGDVLSSLQKSIPLLYMALEISQEDTLEEDIMEQIKQLEDYILTDCATLNVKIKRRLEELSNE
jgi:hypothetical protein